MQLCFLDVLCQVFFFFDLRKKPSTFLQFETVVDETKPKSDRQSLFVPFCSVYIQLGLKEGKGNKLLSVHPSNTCPVFVFLPRFLPFALCLHFSSSCCCCPLPFHSFFSIIFSLIFSPPLITVLDQIGSLLPPFPPSRTCCQLFIIISQINLSRLIIFCVGMWSVSQVGEPPPTTHFSKILLPIWEPSHPMPAKQRVCVCVFLFFFLFCSVLSHFHIQWMCNYSSHCVSLY